MASIAVGMAVVAVAAVLLFCSIAVVVCAFVVVVVTAMVVGVTNACESYEVVVVMPVTNLPPLGEGCKNPRRPLMIFYMLHVSGVLHAVEAVLEFRWAMSLLHRTTRLCNLELYQMCSDCIF